MGKTSKANADDMVPMTLAEADAVLAQFGYSEKVAELAVA